MKFILGSATILALLGPASAHSWVEELQVIDSASGNYTGDYGYVRGYVARTDPGFNGDSVDYLLPALASGRTRIDNTDLLCHPSQRTSNYANSKYPRLQAAAGSYVAMKYLENGHVSLPLNQKGKPKAGGTVFVYGTTKPSNTEKIADVLKWNTAGTGGDGRGAQLAAQNFDDGRCHQLNSGTISMQRQASFPDHVVGQPDSAVEQWCETDVHIPSTYKPGDVVTVYWVWQWPTAPGTDPSYPTGKDEYYTSCAEIDIVDSVSNQAPIHTLVQQDPQTTAVSDFKSRTAYTTSAGYNLAGGATGSAATSPSSAATTAPTASASSPTSSTTTQQSNSATYNPSNPFPSHGSGFPQPPFFHGPSNHPLPSFITVTDYITMSDVANKQPGPATKTQTQWVTSYVTVAPSTVVVPAAAAVASSSSASGLPFTVIAVPGDDGNAGLIGRRFRL